MMHMRLQKIIHTENGSAVVAGARIRCSASYSLNGVEFTKPADTGSPHPGKVFEPHKKVIPMDYFSSLHSVSI